jgi:hypothetical protein
MSDTISAGDCDIECTSLSFSYDVYGNVTITYTTFFQSSGTPSFCYTESITAGGQDFDGYVTSMSLNKIPETKDWYETHVTVITRTAEVN